MIIDPYLTTTQRARKRLSAVKLFDFNRHRRNVYSQNGEDGILSYLLAKAPSAPRRFVEFGAWDGRHFSNCALLAENGWSGMFIEADPDRQITLAANYATRPDIQCVLGKVTSSGPACLDALVAAHGALLEIGVLSIDINGNDYHVWRGSVKLSPAIVIIEFNPTIPADVMYAQPDDPDEAFGSSLAALTDLAADKGYRLVAATEWNAFFMQENLCVRAICKSTPRKA